MKKTLLLAALVGVCFQQASAASRLDFDVIKVQPSRPTSEHPRTISTLVFSCMDFRVRDEVARLMENIGLADQYDEVVLPGASIAVAGEKYPYWGAAADDVIKLSQEVHKIKQVIIIDHRDCGAFKRVYGRDIADITSPTKKENEMHLGQMRKAVSKIKSSFPDLQVYVYLMSIDGTVENYTHKL